MAAKSNAALDVKQDAVIALAQAAIATNREIEELQGEVVRMAKALEENLSGPTADSKVKPWLKSICDNMLTAKTKLGTVADFSQKIAAKYDTSGSVLNARMGEAIQGFESQIKRMKTIGSN